MYVGSGDVTLYMLSVTVLLAMRWLQQTSLDPGRPAACSHSPWEHSPGLTLRCLPSLKQIPLSVPTSLHCLGGGRSDSVVRVSPELPPMLSTLQCGFLWVSHRWGCIWCLWPGASRRDPDWTAQLTRAIFTSRADSELCSKPPFQSQRRARRLCCSF